MRTTCISKFRIFHYLRSGDDDWKVSRYAVISTKTDYELKIQQGKFLGNPVVSFSPIKRIRYAWDSAKRPWSCFEV
jgi:hypothetical protein